MKTKQLLLLLTTPLAFISCTPVANASCYGLTGYEMLNCLEQDKRQSTQDSYYLEQQKERDFQYYEHPLPKMKRIDRVQTDSDGNVYNQQIYTVDDY
jgi:hypothetical protein